MSCPYLEKGKTAYCHAYGEPKLALESLEFGEFCFSGEFSECSFLFLPVSAEWGRRKGQKNSWSAPLEGLIVGKELRSKALA